MSSSSSVTPAQLASSERVAAGAAGGLLDRSLTPIVCGLVAVFSTMFVLLQIRQHVNYGTYGYDLGLYDQATWLIGQDPGRKPFLTSRGLPLWGHHVNPILLLLSPLTRLGAGAMFFSGLQTVAIFAGALPVAWLTRSKTGSAQAGLGLAIVYLMYPANMWFAYVYFHPELLAPLPMLSAAWFAHRRRVLPMWCAAIVALSCREEVSIAVAGFAALVCIGAARSRSKALAINAAALFTVSVAWFVICTRMIIPGALGGQPFYIGTFYGQYGDSFGQIAGRLITEPSLTGSLVTDGHRGGFLIDLLAPVGFVPLIGLPVLMSVAPLFGLLLSSNGQAQSIQSHYPAILIAGVFLGLIDGMRRLWPYRIGRLALALVLVSSVGASVLRGPAPWSINHPWKTSEPRKASLDQALALIPEGAAVSAVSTLIPHLSHRKVLYQFPNPMERWFYGEFALEDPTGQQAPPARYPVPVDWIVVERSAMGSYSTVLDRAVEDGTFGIVFDQNDVVVAQRVASANGEYDR